MSTSPGEVERLYAMTIHGLYEELGRSLTATEYAKPAALTREAAVERGQALFSRFREKLIEKICRDWNYCGKRGEYGDFQTLAYALAPLVSSVAGVPATTAMVVTIILIKIGLDKLCNCPTGSS